MRILDGGLMSTVQDRGRFGYQDVGVTPSGALDQVSHRLANHLVGNPRDAATIEATLQAPVIEFTADALVAICGADVAPTIADVDVPMWCAIAVRTGAVLRSARAGGGTRAYIAIGGGIASPVVMGSRSTYVRAALGGHFGRPLQAGDELEVGSPTAIAGEVARAISAESPVPFALLDRTIDPNEIVPRPGPVRFVRGPHFDMLGAADRRAFVTRPFEISPRSDRMGYRLIGPRLKASKGDLLSTGVAWGTVQLPPSGEPIILMADRQTTGGYPIVANVITADLARVAQMRPGDPVTFSEVSVDEAQQLLREQERRVEAIMARIA